MKRTCLAFLAMMVAAPAWALDPASFLPGETDGLVVIKSKELNQTPLLKSIGNDLLKTLLKTSKQASDAVEASGLDLMNDVDTVYVGIDLDNNNESKPFGLIEGKFDIKKIEASIAAYMEKHKGRIVTQKIGEINAYKINGDNAAQTMYSAVVSDTLMVIAPTEDGIKGAFAGPKRKPIIGKEIAAVLATPDPKAPIFFKAWVKGKLSSFNLPSDKLKAQIGSLESLVGYITVDTNVNFALVGNTPNPQAAQQLSDLLGSTVTLLRLQMAAATGDAPELKPVLELLKSTRVRPNGNQITSTGNVKGAAIEQALKDLQEPKKK